MKKLRAFAAIFVLLILSSHKLFAQMDSTKPQAMFNHLALYVYDLKASTDFYKDVIGLDTIPEPFHDGRHTWFQIAEKGHLHLISGNKKGQQHIKDTHLCFSVGSVDAVIEKLKTANIHYENWAGDANSITTRVDGVKQIYFQDPDGFWLEINDAKE
jgi:lactoylglutathione lyase